MSKENAKKKTETATSKDFEVEVNPDASFTVYTNIPVCEELQELFAEWNKLGSAVHIDVKKAEEEAARKRAEEEAARKKAEAEERRMEAERRKAKDEEAVKNGQIGYTMYDGTIFAGISPDTGKPMYAAPKDASCLKDFNEAAEYAKDLQVGDKKDFRVPTKAELNVLFQNKEKGALKGTFNLTGSGGAAYYWSSTPFGYNYAWNQRFSDGYQYFIYRFNGLSVRCVR